MLCSSYTAAAQNASNRAMIRVNDGFKSGQTLVCSFSAIKI